MTRVRRILFPTDFSRSAGKALEHAADLALKYDAAVDVVHVISAESRFKGISLRSEEEDPEVAGDPLRFHRKSAVAELNRALSDLDRFGVSESRGRLVPGNPSRAILAISRSGDYQLIVMATHGGSGLADVLIGSCTERVVRRSSIPVLVIPSPRDMLDEEPWKDTDLEEFSGWVAATGAASSRALP